MSRKMHIALMTENELLKIETNLNMLFFVIFSSVSKVFGEENLVKKIPKYET